MFQSCTNSSGENLVGIVGGGQFTETAASSRTQQHLEWESCFRRGVPTSQVNPEREHRVAAADSQVACARFPKGSIITSFPGIDPRHFFQTFPNSLKITMSLSGLNRLLGACNQEFTKPTAESLLAEFRHAYLLGEVPTSSCSPIVGHGNLLSTSLAFSLRFRRQTQNFLPHQTQTQGPLAPFSQPQPPQTR